MASAKNTLHETNKPQLSLTLRVLSVFTPKRTSFFCAAMPTRYSVCLTSPRRAYFHSNTQDYTGHPKSAPYSPRHSEAWLCESTFKRESLRDYVLHKYIYTHTHTVVITRHFTVPNALLPTNPVPFHYSRRSLPCCTSYTYKWREQCSYLYLIAPTQSHNSKATLYAMMAL